jgi:hypothetical protein
LPPARPDLLDLEPQGAIWVDCADGRRAREQGRGLWSACWEAPMSANLPKSMATKMRQSLDEFERAFVEETHVDRVRRESLRRKAILRSRQRSLEKVHKRGTARFVMLVLMIIATAVIVTIAMFQTLAYMMG